MSRAIGRLFDSYGNALPASVKWDSDFEGGAFAFVDAPELRPSAIAFRMKQFAKRDRLRFSEVFADTVARVMSSPLRAGPRVQKWKSGGPYPMVNVDADTWIAYAGNRSNGFVVATDNFPEISVCPPGCTLPTIT